MNPLWRRLLAEGLLLKSVPVALHSSMSQKLMPKSNSRSFLLDVQPRRQEAYKQASRNNRSIVDTLKEAREKPSRHSDVRGLTQYAREHGIRLWDWKWTSHVAMIMIFGQLSCGSSLEED